MINQKIDVKSNIKSLFKEGVYGWSCRNSQVQSPVYGHIYSITSRFYRELAELLSFVNIQ